MNKTISTTAAVTAALLGTAAAQEAGSIYLEVGLGAAFDLQDDVLFEGTTFDEFGEDIAFSTEESLDLGTGAGFRLLGGYNVTEAFAIELEVQATGHEIADSDSVAAFGSYTVNAVYSPAFEARIQPYVGAGVGVGFVGFFDEDGDELDDDFDSVLAYQLKAGAILPVGVHHGFGAQLAYHGYGTFEETDAFDQTAEIDYDGLSATISYRFDFGVR